jgi:hypothetical protein
MSHVFPLRNTLPALRRLAFALVLPATLLGVTTGVHAQQCQPVAQADKFIEQGVASIQGGETKGMVLRGAQAVSFGQEVGVGDVTVLAVFLVSGGGEDLLMVVFRTADGSEGVCFGGASPAAKAAVEKHYGRQS